MSTLQFPVPAVSPKWADAHNTHPAVAAAIHAHAGPGRTAEEIWEAPTPAEWDQVAIAVENYLENGVFNYEDDGRYPWGAEAIVIA